MKVLSLCDGMSCGHIALDRVGIAVEEYYAAEIKEIGIKVTKANYPETIHIGDVNKISFKDGVLHTEKGCFDVGHIDLVIFGSPCQTFSVAMKADLRVGLENKEKSGLFLECHRILKEVNPTWFLMENVARMKEDDKNFISQLMGVKPIRINSALVSAQLRDRYYWTNIPGIEAPPDKGIKLQDILTSGYTDREKARALLVSDSRPLVSKDRMIHRYRNTGFTTIVWEEQGNDNSVRYMNQTELERCQTVPEGYTRCLDRNDAADVLGDGWTVDVIAHILSYIKTERSNKEMELRVNEVQLPDSLSFNYEELKQELQEKVSMYETLVYTDEQIKEAKVDRAKLNSLKKALNDERIRREKEWMVPFNDFKAKINEIIGIIDKPVLLIDKQVKEYEEKQKEKKFREIHDFFITRELPDDMPGLFEKIFSEKWLGASVSMKSIREEINARLEQVEKDLATLSDLPEFGFEAAEVYKTTLDLNKAISEAKRMAEIAKAKAAREAEQARLAAEAEVKKQEREIVNAPDGGTYIQDEDKQGFTYHEPVPQEPQKEWVAFACLLTVEDAQALGQFFNSRGISYKQVDYKEGE